MQLPFRRLLRWRAYRHPPRSRQFRHDKQGAGLRDWERRSRTAARSAESIEAAVDILIAGIISPIPLGWKVDDPLATGRSPDVKFPRTDKAVLAVTLIGLEHVRIALFERQCDTPITPTQFTVLTRTSAGVANRSPCTNSITTVLVAGCAFQFLPDSGRRERRPFPHPTNTRQVQLRRLSPTRTTSQVLPHRRRPP